jgi:Cu/Zn superoxide dismutase
MNIVQNWKKFMAVGCSHGDHIDPEARDAVLKFAGIWKPKTRLHLGDLANFAALRSGAIKDSNTSDHSTEVQADLNAAKTLIAEYRPHFVTLGNHDDRAFQLSTSPNALLSRAAQSIVDEMETTFKKYKVQALPYHPRRFVTLGDTKFLHGFLFNVAAIRDTAETYGRVVHAHVHRTGEEQARTLDGATGYAVGMLAHFDPEYSKTKRQSLAHKQGFAYGEYSDKQCVVHICSRAYGYPWRLPI